MSFPAYLSGSGEDMYRLTEKGMEKVDKIDFQGVFIPSDSSEPMRTMKHSDFMRHLATQGSPDRAHADGCPLPKYDNAWYALLVHDSGMFLKLPRNGRAEDASARAVYGDALLSRENAKDILALTVEEAKAYVAHRKEKNLG